MTRHVLWTLPHPEAAIDEWIRVLRVGGRLVVVDSHLDGPGPPASENARTSPEYRAVGDQLPFLEGPAARGHREAPERPRPRERRQRSAARSGGSPGAAHGGGGQGAGPAPALRRLGRHQEASLKTVRIITPTGHLGTTPLEKASFERGCAASPDFIVADSGSADIGPYPLGADRPACDEVWQRHDIEAMLLAARRLADSADHRLGLGHRHRPRGRSVRAAGPRDRRRAPARAVPAGRRSTLRLRSTRSAGASGTARSSAASTAGPTATPPRSTAPTASWP